MYLYIYIYTIYIYNIQPYGEFLRDNFWIVTNNNHKTNTIYSRRVKQRFHAQAKISLVTP